MNLNQNIAYYRKLCGYTQEQLAEKIGVSGQSISKWENGLTNPDVTVLPVLAKALGVDINALFADEQTEPKRISFTELPELCYDALLELYTQARRTFYGKKDIASHDKIRELVDGMKKDFSFPLSRCAYMIDEGGSEYGSVFVSEALSFVDNCYGGLESAVLFDLDKAGELLSVLGDRNARKVLKVIYEKKITEGEGGTWMTPEQLAEATGLTVDAVNEAAIKLRHVRLIDEIEKIDDEGYKKEYSTLYTKDFVSVLAILRLAHVHASDMIYTTLMYRGADNCLNYDGGGVS